MFLIKSTIHHQYSLWFFRFMWLKTQFTMDHLRHWSLMATIVLSTVIGLQMLYPRSLTLPRTRISGEYVGFQSQNAVTSKLQTQEGRDITVDTIHNKQTISPKVLGVSINSSETATKATSYSWRERFIPFSWLFIRRHLTSYELSVDESKLQAFANELTKQNKAPVNAVVKIDGVTASTVPSVEGYAYEPGQTHAQLTSAKLTNELVIAITPKTIDPAIDTKVAEQVTSQVKQRLDTPLEIEAVGTKLAIDKQTMASWIVIKPDTANKTIAVEFDRAKIKAKLLTLSSKVYIAETPNKITLVDGESVGSNKGMVGQALLLDDSINEVVASATTGKTSTSVKLQAITPNTEIVRTYTKTSKGLQALINYWVQTHGGQFGITLRDTSGTIVAGYNSDKQFTSASVYKIFVAYIVYSKVAEGTLSLDATTSTGASVASCMDRMIVWSDNGCAMALGSMIGWQSNNGKLQAKGFGSTNLESGAHLTTANDTNALLMSLAKDELVRSDLNKAYIELLSRQKYRMGIPAGSKGSSVANKIGDSGTYQHDVAIVYHPKGAYVLSVLSAGSSLYTISNLAQQISNTMNQ